MLRRTKLISQSKYNRQPTDDQWMCVCLSINQPSADLQLRQGLQFSQGGGDRGGRWFGSCATVMGLQGGRTVKEGRRTVGDRGTSGIRQTHTLYTTLLSLKMRAIFMLFTDSSFSFYETISCVQTMGYPL